MAGKSYRLRTQPWMLNLSAVSLSLVDVIVIVKGWPIIIGVGDNVTLVKFCAHAAEASAKAVQTITSRPGQRLFVRK
jgi:hypothetical protein